MNSPYYIVACYTRNTSSEQVCLSWILFIKILIKNSASEFCFILWDSTCVITISTFNILYFLKNNRLWCIALWKQKYNSVLSSLSISRNLQRHKKNHGLHEMTSNSNSCAMKNWVFLLFNVLVYMNNNVIILTYSL